MCRRRGLPASPQDGARPTRPPSGSCGHSIRSDANLAGEEYGHQCPLQPLTAAYLGLRSPYSPIEPICDVGYLPLFVQGWQGNRKLAIFRGVDVRLRLRALAGGHPTPIYRGVEIFLQKRGKQDTASGMEADKVASERAAQIGIVLNMKVCLPNRPAASKQYITGT